MTDTYSTPPPPAPPAITEVMERLGVRMTFARGEEIFRQDEDADLLHSVTVGAVRTTRLLNDGRRQVGNFYYKGELIGPEPGAVHRFSAEALTDCVVRVVKRSSLRVLSGDGELDTAIWDATRRELERTQDHLLVLSRKSACQRVASFLLSVADREAALRISLPMGRQDMADYLGLTIETVSRMVTQLQAMEVVEFTGFRHFRVTRWDALALLAA